MLDNTIQISLNHKSRQVLYSGGRRSSMLDKLSLSITRQIRRDHPGRSQPANYTKSWPISFAREEGKSRDRCQLFVIGRPSRYRSALSRGCVFSTRDDGYCIAAKYLGLVGCVINSRDGAARLRHPGIDRLERPSSRQRASNASKCARSRRQKRIARMDRSGGPQICIKKPSAKADPSIARFSLSLSRIDASCIYRRKYHDAAKNW